MIALIDYGMGNLHSVLKALEKVGAQVKLVTRPDQIEAADKIVLPGVGAFKDAINTLHEKELVEPIKKAIADGKWFLGICLGLQMLFDISYEDGEFEGLGIIPGKVKRFDFTDRQEDNKLKIPHMGWNSLKINPNVPLYRGIDDGAFVYFVHSYYVEPADESLIATTTDHGGAFASSIHRDNLIATQFHPEKSQKVGLKMLKNFTEL